MTETSHRAQPAAEAGPLDPGPAQLLPYETPVLERLGTFRELTLAGGGGNCDPSLVLGPETGNTGGNLGRCYE